MIKRYKLIHHTTPVYALHCTCNTHIDIAKKWVGDNYYRGVDFEANSVEVLTLLGWKTLKLGNFLLSAKQGEFFIMEESDFHDHYALDRGSQIARIHIKPKTDDLIALQFTGFNVDQILSFTNNKAYIYENPIMAKDVLMLNEESVDEGYFIMKKAGQFESFEVLKPWELYQKYEVVRRL